MASLRQSIRTYLLSKPVITAIVGQRIYANVLPQKCTLPAVEMEIVSEVSNQGLYDGAGIQHARIQLRCYDDRQTETEAFCSTVRTCGIHTLKGLYQGVDIRGVEIMETFSFHDDSTDGSDEPRMGTAQDLMITYLE